MNAEDLADLFELELDKLKNQYETVQRGAEQQADNQVDETLERLRELARRQEQEIERVGGDRPIPTSFRLVAATNVDLEQAVKQGNFRQDLYYRLNVARFQLATRNRFFLCIESIDPKFDREATRRFLESLGPQGVYEVEH